MADFHVRNATHDDLDGVLRVRSRSFGPLGAGGEAWWQHVADEVIPTGRMVIVTDSAGTVVASGRTRPFEQSWGGRHQPMGGIAGIYVDPRVRGRNVATMLMTALLERTRDLGDAVSALYPTVPGLYRRVGYELGGTQTRLTFAAPDVRALRHGSSPVQLREAGPSDAATIRELARGEHERHRSCGPILHSEDAWAKHLADDSAITYLAADDADRPVGVVAYTLENEQLGVTDAHALSADVRAALWTVVGSGSSAAKVVHSYVEPRDPIMLSLAAPAVELKQWPWMFRVVDLANAVERRGFSPCLNATAHFRVVDEVLPANSGTWSVTVSGGVGRAERVDDEADAAHVLTLDARGLAAVWCGWGVPRVRAAGLAGAVESEVQDTAALDAIFAGEPFMTTYF